ncbi:MAG: winged helix-turn-helix domain-containing protein, partial [Chitinophagaceae bacterium]|nr:winged helix-turn-helix domain-containing protein [Rubrivivax sp.]
VAEETVSRAFTALNDAGLIAVENRRIDILDLAALAGFRRRVPLQKQCTAGPDAHRADRPAGRACTGVRLMRISANVTGHFGHRDRRR